MQLNQSPEGNLKVTVLVWLAKQYIDKVQTDTRPT